MKIFKDSIQLALSSLGYYAEKTFAKPPCQILF